VKLFSPLQVGSRIFKNRIMFSPINFCYEENDECLSPETIQYLTDIARGGTAYLVLGEIYPIDVKKKSPKILNDHHIEVFKTLCDSIHNSGALIGAQLYYPDQENLETISKNTLLQIQKDFFLAVDRLVSAGFDAIQLSGEMFLGSMSSSYLNKRTDEYGGNLQNRLRFVIELIHEIKKNHPNTILEYKLAVTDISSWKGLILDEAKEAAKMLESAGINLIHASFAHSSHGETVPAMGIKSYGCFIDIASAIKKEVSIPVSAVGRIIEAQTAEAILETNQADIIAMGRNLLADPYWPEKVLQNKPIRYCVFCNNCLDKIADEKKLACSLHVGTGSDQWITQRNKIKHCIVAGGGPAGLEAARLLALQGNTVTLYEKTFHLGGQVLLASVPPRKQELLRFVNFLVDELIRLKVDIQLGKKIDEDFIIAQKPDQVFIAVGAKSVTLPLEGAELPHVFDSWDILRGRKHVFGEIAVIGGGLVGIEVAEYLCTQGNRVSIIEMENAIGIGQSSSIWPKMMENYAKNGVRFYPSHILKRITKNEIICHTKNGDVHIPCDTVVMAVNGKSIHFPLDKMKQAGIQVDHIGDCKQIGNIEAAVISASCAFAQ
jgi:2,4-dienoyl-CoA reductase-like NADH-dependent reductase (Old Yellow Enzyme family)/thioredoxin reductase